jgi:transglutaminase-like putative cysteine protease
MTPQALRLSLRVLGGRLGADWERERRDTLLLMGVILLAVLPSLGRLPLWCSAGFMLLFLWRLGLIFSGRALPGLGIRVLAGLASVVGVLVQYDTILGREAGVALLVLFLGLKLMEMRARRDLFVLISLCFFLLLTGFFNSQSPSTAVLTVLATAGLLLALLTLHYGQREVPLARRAWLILLMLAQSLPLAAMLFMVFPRLPGPLWGMPEDGRTGRTGMSGSMQPGQIANLVLNDDVAMRVQFQGAAPSIAQMYWRGPTLGHYDGRTWTAVRHETGVPPRAQVHPSPDGASIRYQLTLEPHGDHWLFALEHALTPPRAPDLSTQVSADHQWLSAAPVTQRLRYQGHAQADAIIGLDESALSLQNWLQLPAGHHQRTLELAARWQRQTPDPATLVERALEMFRSGGFRYTPNPPPLPDQVVDRFLFETRAGFCEHYASAFVVLMRALDIPARVVTGYQGAERHPSGDYWIVRQADAHAWAEVWLAGRGWVRIDPTAAVVPDRIDQGARATRDQVGLASRFLPTLMDNPMWREWRLSLDGVANRWNQWVLNYDRQRQTALLSRMGLDAADPKVLVAALGLVLMLGVGTAALIAMRPRHPRDPIQAAWDRFCIRLANAGLSRHPDETALKYLSRIERLLDPQEALEATQIVQTYCRLRYDPTPAAPEQVRQFRRRIDAFKIA